jgi:hypothetical protein
MERIKINSQHIDVPILKNGLIKKVGECDAKKHEPNCPCCNCQRPKTGCIKCNPKSTLHHIIPTAIAGLYKWKSNRKNNKSNAAWLSPACHVKADRDTTELSLIFKRKAKKGKLPPIEELKAIRQDFD